MLDWWISCVEFVVLSAEEIFFVVVVCLLLCGEGKDLLVFFLFFFFSKGVGLDRIGCSARERGSFCFSESNLRLKDTTKSR